MIKKIVGTIASVQVLPEYEREREQEVDIYLESGPTIEMCVTPEDVQDLMEHLGKVAKFDISDVTLCGQHARATGYEIE